MVRPTKGLEMKPTLLSLIIANQFDGLDNEDPYIHLTKFYGTMGISRENEKVAYLRLFPFSLNGKEKNLL